MLQSLDEGHDDPAALERAWRGEIGRRMREIREGEVKPIPADEVFAERVRCSRSDAVARERRARPAG